MNSHPLLLAKSRQLSASAYLKVSEITTQVRVLDGLMRYRFQTNAELMGEWAGARNVLGPFRSKVAGGSQTLREAQGRPPKAA